MIRPKIQKFEMVTRAANCLARFVSLFPKTTAAAKLTKDIQSAVERLSQLEAEQAAAKVQKTASRNLRLAKQAALRGQVEAIHQTAEALGLTGFPLSSQPSVSELFDAVRNYPAAVGSSKQDFVLYGLPPDFIENLKSAAEDLRAAIESQLANQKRGKATIQEFNNTLEEALGYVQLFDALVSNTMSDNPSVMAAWEVARRVDRPRVSKRPADASSTASPPAPTTIATAA